MTDNDVRVYFIISLAVNIMFFISLFIYYNKGYKDGYVKSLVNQEKGLDHEFVLEETYNG